MVNTLTSQLQGVVRVPLFTLGTDPGSQPSGKFNAASYAPVIAAGVSAVNSHQPFLTGINLQLLMPGSLLPWTVRQAGYTGGVGGSFAAPSYFDNAYWVGTSGGTPQYFYRQPLPLPVANQTVVVQPNVPAQVDSVIQTNKNNFSQFFPTIYQGQNAGMVFFLGQNPGMSCDIWVPATNNFIVHAYDLSVITGLAVVNIVAGRMVPGAAAFSNIAQYDNTIVVWPGTFGPRVLYLNSLTGAQAYMNLALDNSTLNTMFQANAQPANPTIFPYGYIYPLPITSSGNIGPLTGQSREVLVFNTDLTQYYAIQFIPQDATVSALMASTDFFNFRWSPLIDEFGIVWFQNGLTHTITSSFSAISLFFPTVQVIPLNPFTLPCYNTCSPVELI